MSIKKTDLGYGVTFRKIDCTQFKTNIIAVYFRKELSRDDVTQNSLVPYVLKSGTKNYPTDMRLSKHLQELYGTKLGLSVSKVGENQVIGFKMSFVREEFLEENILESVISILSEIIFSPVLEDGVFLRKYVDTEKEVLKESILAKINDKGHYAKEMCIEKMCEEEPYGIVEEGYLEDLDEITPETLYQQYQNLLSYSLVDIVVEGTMDFDRTVGLIQKYFSFPTERSFVLKNEVVAKTVETVKEYEETMDIEQGKLVMGFRTNRSIRDDDYYALLMYSVILGNGSFSKLFRVIREKYSLCYSIGTSLEKLKGIMFIQTGIDSKNKAQVMRLIQEQMKEMEMKNISEEETLQGKKLVINGFKSVKDSVMGLCDFYYFQTLHGNEKSIEEIIDSIQSVTVEEIAKVAHDIQLDTIFFLRGKGEVSNETT